MVFASTSGDPAAVARRVAAGRRRPATSREEHQQPAAQTVSSITTVDLTGISRIEEAFAVALAAAAMALFVTLAITERRHEFATMAALGASLRDIGAFVWSEVAVVLGAALLLAAVLGWLLSQMLVAMLQHVFDPPPTQLTVPWVFLAGAGRIGAGGGDDRRPPHDPRDRPDAARCHTSRGVTEPRILIAEDDAELRGAILRGLREEGFAVMAAARPAIFWSSQTRIHRTA